MVKDFLKRKGVLISLFVVAVVLLTLASTYKALFFGFWRDDWRMVWAMEVLKDPSFFDGSRLATVYPMIYYRLLLFSNFLDTSPFGWQLSNIFFRLIVPFSASLFLYGVTKSKKAAILSALFLAAGIAGVEPASFLGANNVTIYIIPLTIGFYFWITSLEQSAKDNKFNLKGILNKRYFAALLIFSLITKGEQWSYFITPFVALTWDLLYLVQNRSKSNLKILAVRNIILWGLLYILYPLEPNGIKGYSILRRLGRVEPAFFKNFLISLGNLILGSIFYIRESGGITSPTTTSLVVGAIIFSMTIFLGLGYFRKSTHRKMIVLFLLFWTFIYYFPNWVYETTLTVGASHRYLTISSIGLYGLFAYFLSRVKNKRFVYLVATIFILNNIYLSNRTLSKLSEFRSNRIIESVITAIDNSIPAGQQDAVIYYEGDGKIRGFILDWSSGIPIPMRRNIADRKKFPIWLGANREKVRKLLCGEKVVVNLIGTGEAYERGGYPLPKENIHAFYVKDTGEVLVNSEKFRDSFDLAKECAVEES